MCEVRKVLDPLELELQPAMLAVYPTKAMSFLNCWAVFHPQVANFFEATNSHKMCQGFTYLFTILKMNINILVYR